MNDLPRPSTIGSGTLDADMLNAAVIFDVHGFASGSVQVVITEGSFSSGVLTLERSNDGVEWLALTTPVTVTSAGITSLTIDSNFIRARVSTANGADLKLRLSANGRL